MIVLLDQCNCDGNSGCRTAPARHPFKRSDMSWVGESTPLLPFPEPNRTIARELASLYHCGHTCGLVAAESIAKPRLHVSEGFPARSQILP